MLAVLFNKRIWRSACFFISQCLGFNFFAQDTVQLKNVEISVSRYDFAAQGKKIQTIDSLSLAQFRFSNISDVLSYNTPVHIKTYGPGGISSSTFRGGSAEQTAVLWNGFNLQNTMLGQTDLSLLPAMLFDDISLEYGGSSALWGSGAVGGSIHLNNKTLFSKGFSARVNAGGGSFGTKNGSAVVVFSKDKLAVSTRLYANDSENDFEFKNPGSDIIRKQRNASYNARGWVQELRLKTGKNSVLDLNAWLSNSQRELPSLNQNTTNKSDQRDAAARFNAQWHVYAKRLRSVTRAGAFFDRIRYSDSLAGISSNNLTRSLMVENENFYRWGNQHEALLGLSVLNTEAVSDSYSGRQGLNRISLFLGNKFVLAGGRLVSTISLRAEYFSPSRLPVTGNWSAEYRISRGLTIGLNGAKVYRQPTLNELYWLPGGNPQLSPEQGYTAEGFVAFKRSLGRHVVSLTGAMFTRGINNWILWVPGENGNPSPHNLQKVWSRGTETNWQYAYRFKKGEIGFSALTSYVLSTVSETHQYNNASQGRQLIYTPRYAANGSFRVVYRHSSVVWLAQYNGYRFVTSDNSQWLEPYHLSSLRFNQAFESTRMHFVLYAACNNVFNRSYTVMTARPMPLRHFELGISVITKKIKSKTNKIQP